MHHLAGRAADLVIAVATAFVIIAVTIPLFLNPLWVSFEQGRSEAAAWTGFSETDLRAATGSILNDLVIGPPDFEVEVAGTPGPRRDGAPAHARRPRRSSSASSRSRSSSPRRRS